MASFTTSRRISGTPASVFTLITDLDGLPGRIPHIVRVERLTQGPMAKGTRWRETRRVMGKQATEELTVSAFEPGRSYTVECDSHGTLCRTAFHFARAGDDTDVRLELEVLPRSLMAKLMLPMTMGVIRKCMVQDLDALQKAAAGGEATGARGT